MKLISDICIVIIATLTKPNQNCVFITKPSSIKQLLLILVILLMSVAIQAQTTPENIITIFKSDFPGATKTKWSNTEIKGKEFKVQFVANKTKMTAYYNVSGKLIETDKPIDPVQLPEPVTKALETQYGKYHIQHSFIIEKTGFPSLYEIDLKSDGNKSTVIVSRDGFFTAR